MRVSRWRPVCPECGYSLRGSTEPRCPECGVDFPTTARTFRRWAVQRLAWDRVKRGDPFVAYVRTLLVIMLMPWRAGRRLAVPDRWGRAARWAAAHLLVAAVVGTLLANQHYYCRWAAEQIWPSRVQLRPVWWPQTEPPDRVIIWASESLLAWAVVLLVFPLIGSLLSLGIPGRHGAARLDGVKWSLFTTVILIPPIVGWHWRFVLDLPVGPVSSPVVFSATRAPLELPIGLLAALYGLWWAAGMASNRHNRFRGAPAFLLFVVLYGGAWLLVTRVLCPAGDFRSLL